MQPRNPVNWKAAALPLAAFTVALTVGIAYFAGGDGGGSANQGASASDVSFGSAGPHYAPDSPAARRMKASRGESSIDMFKRVNENFSSELSPAAAKPRTKAVKPRTKSEMTEFMRQLRADIDMDLAAQAAAEASASQGAQPGEPGYSGGAGMLANLGQEQKASATTVQGRKAAAGSSRSGSSLKSRKTAFSAGRTTSGMSRTGGLSKQGNFGSSYGNSDTAGSPNSETGHAFVSGSRHNFEAGAYNTQGGAAGAPASAAGAGASAEAPRTMGGGQQEEKQPPAPVAFIWPRSNDFGTMYMYETAARQVIVMNIGDADLKLGKIVNLDDSTPFYAEKDKCSNAVIKPGKSCTFQVRFSPRAQKEYLTGFEIPTNDDNLMAFQNFIEVKGISKHSSYTWWWNQWNRTGGSANRLEFGLVPVGWAMEQELKITNNSGNTWHDIKLDKSALTGAFILSGDACTGRNIGPRQTCSIKVKFRPSDTVNRNFGDSHYGQYHAVNMDTGAKLYHSRPKFPPYVMEKPVEVTVKGKLKVKANFDEYFRAAGREVLSVPLSGTSSANFPVTGIVRVQHYFYFK